jgi:hypothetical protein
MPSDTGAHRFKQRQLSGTRCANSLTHVQASPRPALVGQTTDTISETCSGKISGIPHQDVFNLMSGEVEDQRDGIAAVNIKNEEKRKRAKPI